VRQLLIFSRKHEVSKQVLDLNRTVEDVCRVLHRFVGEDIAFEFDGSSEPTWIEADASMVEQVVMNLCVNARDAMPRGGKLTVMLGREQRRAPDAATVSQTSYAVLSVADTGHGMDEATKARIFEPFFTTKAIGQGTGLGLATVHSIAKQHNGWVEVESAVNVGTTFRVYLPTTNARPPNAAADLEAVRRGHGRVLLVEDDDHVRAAAAKCLKLAGYAVVESTNAVDARANFSSDPSFDLLLSDLIMPGGITGTELAASLRERKPELRVVIMSGYNALSPTHPEPEVPRVVRLTKPFSATQLLDTVAKAMRVG
jgi:CheY-like chemotaxis protein